jgi:hypothetical protein
MNDLSQLFQYAPTVAGGFAGANQANAELMEKLRQMELSQLMQTRTQDAQLKMEKHPLDLEKMMLANETSRAQMPGLVATSRKLGVDADVAEGTKGSTIDSTNTKNNMEAYQKVGGHLGSIASGLNEDASVPPHAALATRLDALGLPAQFKQGLIQRYSKVNPGDLAKRLQEDSDKILRETPGYAQAYDTTAMTTDASIIKSAEDRRSRERIAEADRNAGKFDRSKQVQDATSVWEGVVQKAAAKGARAVYAAANSAASYFRSIGEEGLAARYSAIAQENENQAAAETASANAKAGGINTGEATGLPTNPPASIRPPSMGASAPAANPGAVKSLSDLQKMYPGVPAEKLKELYKKKFGVDLK